MQTPRCPSCPLPKSCCPQDTARASREAQSQGKEAATVPLQAPLSLLRPTHRAGKLQPSAPTLPPRQQPCSNGRGTCFPQSLITARSHTAATITGNFSSWNLVLSMLTIPSNLFLKSLDYEPCAAAWREGWHGEKDTLGCRGQPQTWGYHGQGKQGH